MFATERCLSCTLGFLLMACGGSDTNGLDANMPDGSEAVVDEQAGQQAVGLGGGMIPFPRGGSTVEYNDSESLVGGTETEGENTAEYTEGRLRRLDNLSWRQPVGRSANSFVASLEQGQVPSINDAQLPFTWLNLEQDDDGKLNNLGQEGLAVTELSVAPGEYLAIRADHGYRVWSQESVQPVDPYGSGTSLSPLIHSGDTARIAFYGVAGRGTPSIQVFSSHDPLAFNLRDLTPPDLRSGHSNGGFMGVPVLNFTDNVMRNVQFEVQESEYLSRTVTSHQGLPAGATTQVPIEILPIDDWPAAGTVVPVNVRISSPQLSGPISHSLELTVIASEESFRQTFVSPTDGSVQYYGVREPTEVVPGRQYSLVLSLHGAGVEAIDQARSYSSRDWTYVIAPTNRRPFGFDWEEWGRANAINSLNDAMERFSIDPTRVYLTGHSMGGHGTWHVGATTPTRFAALGPSAGWESFYSYGGSPRPTGVIGRARAHSDTLVYLENIARRGIYIIHGDADESVPFREGLSMSMAAAMYSDDVVFHQEEGAGHWWDGDNSPGVDCVDWSPLFAFFNDRQLDPNELEFKFRTPNPGYSPTHSFLRIESAITPLEDAVIETSVRGNIVTIATENVRSLVVDGTGLLSKEIAKIKWNSEKYELEDGPLALGPTEGKRAHAYGPLNQVFRKPFCFLYPEANAGYQKSVAFMVSYWSIMGNGAACSLTDADNIDNLAADFQWVRLGEMARPIRPEPFQWNDETVALGELEIRGGALFFVQPENDGISAGMVTARGREDLLRSIVPFSSRGGQPDYLLFGDDGVLAAGFFDANWLFNPSLGQQAAP